MVVQYVNGITSRHQAVVDAAFADGDVDLAVLAFGVLGSQEEFEADPDAAAAWTAHCIDTSQGLLLTTVRSWFMGINTNVDGHDKPRYLLYNGGLPAFRRRCDEVAAAGYEGFSMR